MWTLPERHILSFFKGRNYFADLDHPKYLFLLSCNLKEKISQMLLVKVQQIKLE